MISKVLGICPAINSIGKYSYARKQEIGSIYMSRWFCTTATHPKMNETCCMAIGFTWFLNRIRGQKEEFIRSDSYFFTVK